MKFNLFSMFNGYADSIDLVSLFSYLNVDIINFKSKVDGIVLVLHGIVPPLFCAYNFLSSA